MELPILNTKVLQKCILSYEHFYTIVDEIKVHSDDVQQAINDMLDMMNQIKYQHTIQDNIRKHLIETVNNKSITESMKDKDETMCTLIKNDQLIINDSNNSILKSEFPKSKFVQQNRNRDPRFKRIWMTELIYQLIQARNRFNVAINLHPECKYLKSQQKYYEFTVNKAVDRRKNEFFSKKRYKSINRFTLKPNVSSSTVQTTSSNESGISARSLSQNNPNKQKTSKQFCGHP